MKCYAIGLIAGLGLVGSTFAENPMDVFQPMLGTWKTEGVHAAPEQGKARPSTLGEVTARSILDNAFVRMEGFAASEALGKLEYQVIMTYDERRQIYRRWVYRSDGVAAESTGAWNADTQQMTWTTVGLPAGMSFAVTTTMTNEGYQEHMFGRRNGDVFMDLTNTARRHDPS